jgi:tetratricopeptide (TPR) repeat protein
VLKVIKKVLIVSLLIASGVYASLAQDEIASNYPDNSSFGKLPTPISHVINTDGMDPILVMSMAWASYEVGDLGSALQYATRVQRQLGQDSQSNYLMGLVFMHEGLHDLAERSLRLALRYAHRADERADYALALANLYYGMKEYEAMKQQLEDVIFGDTAHDEFGSRYALSQQWRQARNVLQREGLDRVIQLYRWSGLHHNEAVEILALQAYSEDSYESYGRAVELLLYSTVIHAGVLIERLMFYDPSYRFTSLSELLARAASYTEMRTYIETSGIYRTLFLLASSLYAYDRSDVSKIIWNSLRLQPSGSSWVRRAGIRFYEPRQDDFSQEFDAIFEALH